MTCAEKREQIIADALSIPAAPRGYARYAAPSVATSELILALSMRGRSESRWPLSRLRRPTPAKLYACRDARLFLHKTPPTAPEEAIASRRFPTHHRWIRLF